MSPRAANASLGELNCLIGDQAHKTRFDLPQAHCQGQGGAHNSHNSKLRQPKGMPLLKPRAQDQGQGATRESGEPAPSRECSAIAKASLAPAVSTAVMVNFPCGVPFHSG